MNPFVRVLHSVGKTEGRHVRLGHCGEGITEETRDCFGLVINVGALCLAFEAENIVLEFWRIFV
jgi:hypothetical protein